MRTFDQTCSIELRAPHSQISARLADVNFSFDNLFFFLTRATDFAEKQGAKSNKIETGIRE